MRYNQYAAPQPTQYTPSGFYQGFAAAADLSVGAAMAAWDSIRDTTPGAADLEANGYAGGQAAGVRYYDATH